MGKLNEATEALLLQAIADATANMRPCPPLTFLTAGKFAINGWIANAGDGFDHYVITDKGRQELLGWQLRGKK
jgi:hypothetical protein